MSVYRISQFCRFILLAAVAGGCGSHPATQSANQSPALSLKPDTLCFQQVIGRDSVRLQLFTKGTRVTGNLVWRPYQKDRAQGSLIGVRTGDEITADWQRSGEGITQLYVVDFLIVSDTLRWRDGERVEKGGKWALTTSAGRFTYKLVKTECR